MQSDRPDGESNVGAAVVAQGTLAMRRTGAAVGSVFSGEADSSRSRTPADQEQVTEPKLTEVPCPSSGRIGRRPARDQSSRTFGPRSLPR